MIAAIIRWSVANRFLVVLAAIALAMAGVFAMRATPVDALPDLSDTQVIIRTSWPGQAPQIVENQVTYPLVSCEGLRDSRVQPHGGEAVHLRQCLSLRDRHPLSDAERLDDAPHGRADRRHTLRSAAPLRRCNRSGGHPEKQQALSCRPREPGIPGAAHGEILRLRARPFGHKDIGERGACRHDIAWRARIDALNEAAAACLHDRNVAVIELDAAGCRGRV